MENKRHSSSNRRVVPPSDWDDRGGVLRLTPIDATCGKVAGVDVFVTMWQPNEHELACLLRGGLVQLTCVGGQPAMNITAVGEMAGEATRGLILPN